ncbi:MAG: helix-turn-helix domain-containing protein [Caldilineaceae bacterium]|nr:helix-turn-helix domain-containing protein [Caldilineaceae bacterium]
MPMTKFPSNSSPPDDSGEESDLLARLKQTVRKAMAIPTATEERINALEYDMRDAVRQLARNRVGTALRQLRAARGLSYADVQAETGLSQQLLWDVEYGVRRLKLAELKQLAACYQLDADDILGIDLE